ncbi:Acetylornithine deacetylase/Succinyl-diaminopimelate desuccinylase-related protein [Gaiella occulta]|uniref:Acetylornithine deacetylase/Succinyl-diaminopimelate desuccinylase-related protein n=1 Tax=Gaiella occulta TaxID=1002870 RepID=A0A7M2YW72_9ACTN|nr:M20/M25/M40 family metallo-hydrolase [Gaiella occulta]RDI74144.1 Acetylornithine deacetylase/Succinyl-diaminopimelate desuccinylase-related protein [Gaiella occulta]
MTLREEVTVLLRELLRANTVNPPGNETIAAELLRDYLDRNGIPCELVGRSSDRLNLVARLPGGDGPSIALLAHTDTVRADAEEWAHDPWCGDLVDGEIWGRGALDMKSQVAASAVAFASLARDGFRPAGDVILALTADEEVNDDYGLAWLVREHPELVRADYSLNEGGGERCVFGGNVFYLCAVGEKMSAPFRVHVRGRSGHASMPAIADNALVKAAPLIEALGRYAPPQELIPEVARFLELVLGELPPLEEALDRARALHPLAAELVEPLLSFTLAPTLIEASKQRNVIPAHCVVTVDCRLPPGMTPEDADPLVRAALGRGDYELEWFERDGGTRSAMETPLWSVLESWVADVEPGARLAPVVCAGFTDSHWMREAFGTVAYGFFPLRAMDGELASRLVHSADERIPVDDLELGVHALRAAVTSIEG